MTTRDLLDCVYYLVGSWFCKHDFEFRCNLYGDQIIEWNYMRSVWKCRKCHKIEGRHFLHEPREVSKDV